MKRKLTFLLVPVLFLVLGVSLKLSSTRAQEQQTPEQQEEVCMQDAALDFVACKKAAGDEDQRQQCRDFFKCRRDACAAIRQGQTPKGCKPPFMY
jgi:hypothetical protein